MDPQLNTLPSNASNPQNVTSSKTKIIIGSVIALFILLMIVVNSIKSVIPITIPDFKGQSLNLATSELETLGLNEDRILSKSASGEGMGWGSREWQVCGQSIPPGTKVKKDSSIELTVEEDCSKVKDGKLVDVKLVNVVGMKLNDAIATIASESSDLIEVAKEDAATNTDRGVLSESNWIVCSQIPAANSMIEPKSTVTLQYARNADECSTGIVASVEANKQANLEEENKAVEVGGLDRYDSRSSCDRWVDANLGSGFQARWQLGLKYEDVVDEGYGKMWQHNVTVKYKGDDVGTLICKVQGSVEHPIIVEAFVG